MIYDNAKVILHGKFSVPHLIIGENVAVKFLYNIVVKNFLFKNNLNLFSNS